VGVGKRKGNTLNAKICVLSNTFLREIKRSRVKCSYCSSSEGHSVVSDSLQPYGLYSSWNSPGQNTRVINVSGFEQNTRNIFWVLGRMVLS